MEQSQIETLLGRPLTEDEVANIENLEIAVESLSSLLCVDLTVETGTRTFTSRPEYRTVWTGPVSAVTEVKVNGTVVADYTVELNSIVLKSAPTGERKVEVTGEWGYDPLPAPLRKLLDQLLTYASKTFTSARVKSKQVEDFRVTYSDQTEDESFLAENRRTIQKYSMCDVIDLRHSGDVCDDFRRFS